MKPRIFLSLCFSFFVLVSIAQNINTAGNGLYKPTGSSVALSNGNAMTAPVVFDYGTSTTANFLFKKGANNYLSIGNTGLIGVGTESTGARFHLKGTGATSATNNLLIQNSVGSELFRVNDGGSVNIGYPQQNSYFLAVGGPSSFFSSVFFSENNSNPVNVGNSSLFSANEGGLYGDGDVPIAIIDYQNGIARYGYDGLLTVNNQGKVGVGDLNPAARISIKGLGSTSATSALLLQNSSNIELLKINDIGTMSIKKIYIGTTDGTTDTKIAPYALAVNGDAIFNKAKVKLYGNWPDYVFDDNYQLPSLNEIEKFLKLNKHLPEIPSAAEVEKEGIDLGSNQALLLKKVEELTLYIIDLNKQTQGMQKKLEEMDKKNKQLEKKIESGL